MLPKLAEFAALRLGTLVPLADASGAAAQFGDHGLPQACVVGSALLRRLLQFVGGGHVESASLVPGRDGEIPQLLAAQWALLGLDLDGVEPGRAARPQVGEVEHALLEG